MWRRLVAAGVVLALGAPAAGATMKPPVKHAATRVRCHYVVVHRTNKLRRVCVKVKPAPALTKQRPGTQPTPAAPGATLTKAILSPAPVAAAPPAAVATPLVAPTPSAPAPAVVAALAPVPRLQATTREFSVQLSRPAIAAGSVILQLVNGGEDPHDLHVRPAAGGADVLAVDRTDPFGGVTDASGTLAAGSYTLYCSLPGHEAAGMHALLTVK
jgi:plastocyanin